MVLGLGPTRMVVSFTVNEREDDAMTQLAGRYYRLLIRAASSLQSPFLLAVRLYWGWQFMQTGWGKLNDSQKVIGFFTHLGIPAPALNAFFISGLEFAGGPLSHSRTRFETDRAAARDRHGGCLHPCRSRPEASSGPMWQHGLNVVREKERRHYDYDEDSGSPGFRLDVRSDPPDPPRAYRQAC